jgi:zinc protease
MTSFTDTPRLFGALAGLVVLAFAGALQAGPAIQSWQTSNGARVLFVPAPDLPMLDARVVFAAGSARDGARNGVASLTATMLTQGAGEWDADAIAERLESVGSQLGTGAARDMAYVSARTLSRQPALDVTLDTMAAVLARPRFAEEDFERVRQNTLVGLRRDEQDPSTVGQKALYLKIFGDHPYAPDPSGTLESVAALTRDDLVDLHGRYYVGRNAVLALVGDLARNEAEAIAERIVGGLPAGEPAEPLPPVAEVGQAAVEALDFPSTQTHVYAGQPGMKRTDPDYFPLYVGNHILGGSGLVSLLMEEVREKRGLSYSVYSYFLPMAQRGPFLLGLSTKNDQAEEARAVLMDTVRRFRSEGPTQEELASAVKNITGGFPLRIASNADIVQYLAMMAFYDLPLDYLDTFSARVEAVTPEDIRDAFQRRVQPESFATVIVGPQDDQVAKASR